jgi:hypothetical protein
MDILERGLVGVDCMNRINLAQDRDKWSAVVNAAMKL